jgi:type III pantothenate kinase
MILAVDIGNSSIKFGVFDRENLVVRFTVPTGVDKIGTKIFSQFNDKTRFREFSAIVVSSVVPKLSEAARQFGENFFDRSPFFVDHTLDFGLKIKYDPPENLGIDRLVAAFAAAEKYGKPCIVCDFGTATTIDAVNSAGEYLGGVITPGFNTLGEALFLKTAKLPRVELIKPPRVIGNSTVSAIQSGVFFGYIGLTEGILRRMIGELGEKPRVIATGGFSRLIAENCDSIELIDENLMLEGLRLLYLRNSDANK